MSDYNNYGIEASDDQGSDASAQPDERIVYGSEQCGAISTKLGDSVSALVSGETTATKTGQTSMEDWA